MSTHRPHRFLTLLLVGTLAGTTLNACIPGRSSLAKPGEENAAAQVDLEKAARLYAGHCAACHGEERLGMMGPALFPENLSRLKKGEAHRVIAEGAPASQMPGFAETLDEADIAALTAYIYQPPAEKPAWGLQKIRDSRVIHKEPWTYPEAPVYDADPLNLFVVVELADHHATILDGDRMEPIHRFETRFAVHGGPKFSPDGRFVYFSSRDGWISKFDMYALETVAEIRAGINTRNLAISGDGKWVLVGNYLPHTLVLLDAADLRVLRVIPVVGEDGNSSRVSAVYRAEPRNSFIAALRDTHEIWELAYRRLDGGWIHDYNKESGDSDAGRDTFDIRQIPVGDYLDDFSFDPEYRYLIGTSRTARSGQVIDLDKGEKVANVSIPGMPHLASGITWEWNGQTILATPNLHEGRVTVVSLETWETVAEIETAGPGFFMRSHENTPYAWVDVFFGPNSDKIHVVDKATLEIVKTLQPEPGKTAGHVEFSGDGKYALVSIWEDDGAVVVYDSATLEEVKRIPMRKPSGKYNVYNKINLSPGTSH